MLYNTVLLKLFIIIMSENREFTSGKNFIFLVVRQQVRKLQNVEPGSCYWIKNGDLKTQITALSHK